MLRPWVPGSMSAQLLTLPRCNAGETAVARAVAAPVVASITETPSTVNSARRRDPPTTRSVVPQNLMRFLSSGRRLVRRHPHSSANSSPPEATIRQTDVRSSRTVVQKGQKVLRPRSTVVAVAGPATAGRPAPRPTTPTRVDAVGQRIRMRSRAARPTTVLRPPAPVAPGDRRQAMIEQTTGRGPCRLGSPAPVRRPTARPRRWQRAKTPCPRTMRPTLCAASRCTGVGQLGGSHGGGHTAGGARPPAQDPRTAPPPVGGPGPRIPIHRYGPLGRWRGSAQRRTAEMDWNDIERIRVEGFPVARRGYDQRSVDKFLMELADWLETDAAKDIGQAAITRKLELVGKSTAHILLTTEQESEQMRRRAEEECGELRSEAEAAALATRQAADEYAEKVREKAEQEARRIRGEASTTAKQNVEEGQRRRAQIEELVSELNARRDHALAELDHLREEIGSTLERHRSGARSEGETHAKAREGSPAKAQERSPVKGQEGSPVKAREDDGKRSAGQPRSTRGRAPAPPPPR